MKSKIKLYNGDCIEIMKELIGKGVRVNAILSDLPYGVTSESWDKIIPIDQMWDCIKQIRKDNAAVLLFGNEPFSSHLRISNAQEYRYDLYWQKERPTNIFQLNRRPGKVIEIINVFYAKQPVYNPQKTVYNGHRRTNKVGIGKFSSLIDNGNKKPFEYHDDGTRFPLQIIKFKRDILTSNLHPTQKPVELMEYLVKTYTNEGDTVLDFCMGAGSTGVACKNLNRNFIGIEINSDFFKISRKRLKSIQ